MSLLKVADSGAHRLLGDTIALVLAGGRGERLGPLTARRPKAAMPFGGHYRAVDFALSNCVNSEVRRIALLPQHRAQTLIRHVQNGWGFLHGALGEFIDIWPAQQNRGERWYAGPVDAVQQNLELIEESGARFVLVLAGDQVYAMDYSALIDSHVARGAEVTIACGAVPGAEAGDHDIVEMAADGRVERILPPEAAPAEGNERATALAAMGVYVFDTELLLARLAPEKYDPSYDVEFASDLLRGLVPHARVFAHPFVSRDGMPGYWRTLTTVDRYWRAHMELLDEPGRFDFGSQLWPIFTHRKSLGPTQVNAAAAVHSSVIGTGCKVAGELRRSTLSSRCEVGRRSVIKNSVLLPGAHIGEHCVIEDAVVDSQTVIADGTVLRADGGTHGYYVSPGGVVLVTGGERAAEPRPARRKVA